MNPSALTLTQWIAWMGFAFALGFAWTLGTHVCAWALRKRTAQPREA